MKKIPVSGKNGRGLFALVDDEDWPWLMEYRWFILPSGYLFRHFKVRGKCKCTYIHRVIMNAPKGLEVDHQDQNKLNNQKSNLRLCSHSNNQANQKVKSTRPKGVVYRPYKRNLKRPLRPFAARIKVNGIELRLGRFSTEAEAAKAYNEAALRHFGEFALPNPAT